MTNTDNLDVVAAIFAAAKCGTADRAVYLREWDVFRDLLKQHEKERESAPQMAT